MSSRLVFSYLAFSTPHQKDGRSADRQESAAEVWAKAHGLRLAASRQYRDEGLSRYTGKARRKGALSEFLKLCGTPAVPPGSILIIEDFDRLSRELPDDAWELFRQILLAGVEIVVLSLDKWFTKDSLQRFEDRLLVQACQHRAHQESAIKALRQKDKWADRRRRAGRGEGGHTKLPSWVRRDGDGRLALDARCQVDIRFMADAVLAGKGLRLIAKELSHGPNARDCWLPGGKWDGVAIGRVLTSDAVWGAYQPHRGDDERRKVRVGELIRCHYPAALSEDEAKAVRRAMATRCNDRGRPAFLDRSVLRRVARDAETGGFLRLKRVGKGAGHDYLDRRWQGGLQLLAPYQVIETLVLRAVQQWMPDALCQGDAPADRARMTACQKDLAAVAADREAIKAELARPGRAASTVAVLAGQLDALDAREAEAKEALADLEADATGVSSLILADCQSLAAHYASIPADQKPEAAKRLNARLREVLDGVWVYRRRFTARTAELIVQVWTRSGAMKEVRVLMGRPPDDYRPLDTDGADFRAGYPVPLSSGRTAKKARA